MSEIISLREDRKPLNSSRRKIVILAAIVVLSIPAYYLISPLFITTVVNEPLPSTSSLTTVSQGTFAGSGGHSATGTVTLFKTGTGTYVVRFDDFTVTNGPDLNVYLSKTTSPDQGYVDLGNLKGSSGPQNYNVPSSVDLEQYKTVIVWCVSFRVLFGYAQLQA